MVQSSEYLHPQSNQQDWWLDDYALKYFNVLNNINGSLYTFKDLKISFFHKLCKKKKKKHLNLRRLSQWSHSQHPQSQVFPRSTWPLVCRSSNAKKLKEKQYCNYSYKFMDKSILQPLTKKTRNLKKGIWNLLYYWHAGPFLAPEGPEA